MSGSSVSYECAVCGWVYDPAAGDPDAGIPPGTEWGELGADWVCPVCGVGKEEFDRIEVADPATVPDRSLSPIVIIGSGLAGYTLVRELRKRSAERPIILITADGGEVYTKPMLSNALGKGHAPDDLVQKEAADFAREQNITIQIRTRVLSIDRTARRLELDDGNLLEYGSLVLALGADPRIFPAQGSEAVGIATVNDLDDYRAWRARIGGEGRILLIGAGLIGCEFANDLGQAGYEVAVIDPASWPLARLLPREVGKMLTTALEASGVAFHLGRTVSRYEAQDRGFTAILDDGAEVPFDHALSAVGLAPRTALAAGAGLDVKAGIRVNRLLQTSDPAIFALGDCAETEAGPLPFIAPLLAQARVVAAVLTGEKGSLRLPALPVVVKTPALPLTLCPPRVGAKGEWIVEQDAAGAVAVFRTPDGEEIGFALAGSGTERQKELVSQMPDLLPPDETEVREGESPSGESWICDTCGWVFNGKEGDPEGGVEPGTAWEDLPADWVCPVCGVGREEFTKTG